MVVQAMNEPIAGISFCEYMILFEATLTEILLSLRGRFKLIIASGYPVLHANFATFNILHN